VGNDARPRGLAQPSSGSSSPSRLAQDCDNPPFLFFFSVSYSRSLNCAPRFLAVNRTHSHGDPKHKRTSSPKPANLTVASPSRGPVPLVPRRFFLSPLRAVRGKIRDDDPKATNHHGQHPLQAVRQGGQRVEADARQINVSPVSVEPARLINLRNTDMKST